MADILIKSLKDTLRVLRTKLAEEKLLRRGLIFTYENDKLKGIYSFSLPSGWTCPGANICLSKVNRDTGKLTDGPETQVRCFSASQECAYPTVRRARWHNLDLLKEAKTTERMTNLILNSLPEKAEVVRIHVAGDFFNLAYLKAWINVAKARPNVIFYAYTKSIHFWHTAGCLPSNFRLTASLGGKFDELAVTGDYKSARIVLSNEEANGYGLAVDHDDSHAWKGDRHFALLVHGTQPKGSPAQQAWRKQIAEKKLAKPKSAPKPKRVRKPETRETLVMKIIRISKQIWEIMRTPRFVVK